MNMSKYLVGSIIGALEESMSSVKPSIWIQSGRGALLSVLHLNGSNGGFATASPLCDGYADHLQEDFAVFETEDFDAQTYVQSIAYEQKRYCVLSSHMLDCGYFVVNLGF